MNIAAFKSTPHEPPHIDGVPPPKRRKTESYDSSQNNPLAGIMKADGFGADDLHDLLSLSTKLESCQQQLSAVKESQKSLRIRVEIIEQRPGGPAPVGSAPPAGAWVTPEEFRTLLNRVKSLEADSIVAKNLLVEKDRQLTELRDLLEAQRPAQPQSPPPSSAAATPATANRTAPPHPHTLSTSIFSAVPRSEGLTLATAPSTPSHPTRQPAVSTPATSAPPTAATPPALVPIKPEPESEAPPRQPSKKRKRAAEEAPTAPRIREYHTLDDFTQHPRISIQSVAQQAQMAIVCNFPRNQLILLRDSENMWMNGSRAEFDAIATKPFEPNETASMRAAKVAAWLRTNLDKFIA